MIVLLSAVLAATGAWLAVRPSLRRSPGLSMAVSALTRVQRRWASRRRRRLRRAAIREVLAEVVADVRAGQPPARALQRALESHDAALAPRTLAATRWGGDIADAMSADARDSAQPVLASAGACWCVAAAQGAGLADALDRLVAQDRRAEEVRRQLEAHMAAPRATARMLALLPVLGLALGLAVGGDPLGWLLGTSLGRACLGAGVLLIVAGLIWASRIVARTERLL